MRKYYWFITAFARKHGKLVALSLVGAILFFSISLPLIFQFFLFKPTTYVGVVGSYSFTTLPPSIAERISAGLTRYEGDGSVIPNIAERWTIEDEGRTYRFLLKENVRWQDGRVVTPDDITYQLPDVQIVATERDVVFRLNKPFSPFPGILSQPLFRVQRSRFLGIFPREEIIGLGAYRVRSFRQQQDRLVELEIESARDVVRYRFFLSEEEALVAFQHGQVDQITELSQAYDLTEWQGVRVTKRQQFNQYLAIFFNTENSLFQSVELRQALNYALPKPAGSNRATGPISPQSWAYADVAKPYDLDMNRALERLMDEDRGYPREAVRIELLTTPAFSADAIAVKSAWEEFGRELVLRCETSSAIKNKTLCPNGGIQVEIKITNYPDVNTYQVLLVGQKSPLDPDQYALWHTDQPLNFTHYSNPRIDSLLERGRQTDDQQRRREIYQDFLQFFSEDAPVIFVRYLDTYSVERLTLWQRIFGRFERL
jgi:peptide/nickel transport system substrate-binding protein